MLEILTRFLLSGQPVAAEPFGHGHIAATYRVVCDDGAWYILQRINTAVFPDPAALMENIRLVTEHLRRRANDRREVLTLVPTADGALFAVQDGAYWRVYEFVRGNVCFERAATPAIFQASAEAFGEFANRLSDFDAASLSETIPHFHDTPARFAALDEAIRRGDRSRKRAAEPEIASALAYAPFSHTLADLQAAGALPLRVTHNDTKINNVLFDAETGRPLCVIDLDTVMPGLAVNDFGDAIRFGANTAAEDEADLARVALDLGLYEAYLTGYLSVCGASLTELEKELLPVGAKMMALECGVRFLTDYLLGDVYFHTDFPEHNLRRARTQLRLVSDMDNKWGRMLAIRDDCLRAATRR